MLRHTRVQPLLQCSSLFLFFLTYLSNYTALADVGSAAQYNPPYLPTACQGNDPAQFPTSNMFGAAGDGIWDNGASCGRQYLVRCISATQAGACKPGQTIRIRIVDYATRSQSRPSAGGATIVLSETAFGAIADSSVDSINIDFQQV